MNLKKVFFGMLINEYMKIYTNMCLTILAVRMEVVLRMITEVW